MLSRLFIAVLCVMFNCFVTFPCGMLSQVWHLIVSIPALCRLSYFQPYKLLDKSSFPVYKIMQSMWRIRIECKTNKIFGRGGGGGGGILSMWGKRINAIWNLTLCVFLTKCEILVWNTWRIWYNFFTCCEESVPTLLSVKFAKCESCGSTQQPKPLGGKTWMYLTGTKYSP